MGAEEFVYDDAGHLMCKRDGNNTVTMYAYDDHDRLEKVYYIANYTQSLPPSYPQTEDVTYAYESAGSLRTSMTDDSGESEYTYDIQGRLKTYIPPVGLDIGYYVEYDYNNAGQKTRVHIWNGTTTSYDVGYEYFANGWLKKVKDLKNNGNTVAEYAYDEVGNRERVDYGNATYSLYDWITDPDPRYRLSEIEHYRKGSPDVSLGEITYPSRDNVGNPLSIDGVTHAYDENSRLTDSGASAYGYDWVGNRTNPPAAPNPMEYNAADQLTRWPGQHEYTYYDDGSLHEVKVDGTSTVTAHYTYHPTGLLDTATYNSRSLANTWDADDNRVAIDANGSSYEFVYDTTAGIPAVIQENTPGGVVYYIREPGGELIARVDGEQWRYYHFDELGSTRLLTDDDGDITDEYEYDAWGNCTHIPQTGSIDQPYQYVGQLGYYTHWQEPDFGLLQLGVRFYDAGTGRFTQRDAVALDGTSSFAYADERPLCAIDPTGQYMWDITIPRESACWGINPTTYRCGPDGSVHNCYECAWSLLGGQTGAAAAARLLVDLAGTKLPGGGLKLSTVSATLIDCVDKAQEVCDRKKSGALTVQRYLDCVTDKIPSLKRVLQAWAKQILLRIGKS